MAHIETQIGQIYISDKKLSKSFVSLFSEKVLETDSEIYMLLEIPVTRASSENQYEKIPIMLANSLRRSFRKSNNNAFENAIAYINDDLARLAADGQTAWVGKLSACIAVRQNENLYVSATGKMHAYLFRNNQVTSIAESSNNGNPLKTFENFALGKISKKDKVVFSTTQLFNYLSIERFRDLLQQMPLADACAAIADQIKDQADHSIAFGTLILDFSNTVKNTAGAEPAIVQTNPPNERPTRAAAMFSALNLKGFAPKSSFSKLKNKIHIQSLTIPKVSFRAINLSEFKNYKELPRIKKFFLFSAAAFLVVLLVSIVALAHANKVKKANTAYNNQLIDVQNKINDANTAYIYKDMTKALALIQAAKNELNSLPRNPDFETQKSKLAKEINDLSDSLNHVQKSSASELVTYTGASIDQIKSSGNYLYLVNNSSGLIVPYNLKTKALEQDFTIQTAKIVKIADDLTIEDNQGNLYKLDPSNKTAAKQNGHLAANTIGLVTYGSPVKAFTIDKSHNQIINAQLDTAGDPGNYLKQNENLGNSLDLAVDGAIYILNKDNVKKFVSGTEKPFANNGFSLGDGAEIYTNKNFNNIYLLDPASKKIIVLDKKGNLKNQYSSDKFTNPRDFIVDEPNRIIYILNEQTVLTIHL